MMTQLTFASEQELGFRLSSYPSGIVDSVSRGSRFRILDLAYSATGRRYTGSLGCRNKSWMQYSDVI
jgi:hypothetical protein